MDRKIYVPPFIPISVSDRPLVKSVIKRKDNVLEIEFPEYQKEDVLRITEKLALKKRAAHDRPLDDLIDIFEAASDIWLNPNYDLRKEALEIIPIISGQSRKMCEIELNNILQLWRRPVIEAILGGDIGGRAYLEKWVPRGTIRLHAQPRGLVFHNLAGNSFNLGMSSLFNGMITKNVNLVKIARESPYFAVKVAESIREVDKKLAKELAVLYWSGSNSEVYDAIFNSGNVDCVLAWGGLISIEDIRRRANRFGIKVIDHGPKFSFTIISDEVLENPELMDDLSQKISQDIVWFNQKSCLSPRVIFIKERPPKSAVEEIKHNGGGNGQPYQDPIEETQISFAQGSIVDSMVSQKPSQDLLEIKSLMKRSMKLLKDEITEQSPRGFAEAVARHMEDTERELPRENLTQAEVMETVRRREYFMMKYVHSDSGIIFTPKDQSVNWTIVYLRNPPTMEEINMCDNRFLIITRIPDLDGILHYMKEQKLERFLQTFGVYGSDRFVEKVADEFSLLGAFRFPRAGEHNMHKIGTPWDGKYTLADLVKWVYIGFLDINGDANDFFNQENQ